MSSDPERLERKRTRFASSPIGLPPGSLIHVGDRRTDSVYIDVHTYNADGARSRVLTDITELFPLPEDAVTWLNIDGLHDVELLGRVAEKFGLHPLVMEDILNTKQRPKYEVFGSDVSVILKMISLNDEDELTLEQVSILFTRNLVITFQEIPGDVFDPVRQRILQNFGTIRQMGADYLAYALMDIVVDRYYTTLERIGERLDELEDSIPDRAEHGFISRVHDLRQQILEVRRAAWPLREVASALGKDDGPRIDPAVKPYLRDLYDHIITVLDNVEHFREMTTGIRDIYLSSVSIRMNKIMKVLTIISTIFMPLTFITGIYGMNFLHMPELQSRWGYPAVLGVSAVIVLVQLWVFRRRKWF